MTLILKLQVLLNYVLLSNILDFTFQSFRSGEETSRLLDHLVIVTLDAKACVCCLPLHKHCFSLVREWVDFSREAYFMTRSYLKMMRTVKLRWTSSIKLISDKWIDSSILYYLKSLPTTDVGNLVSNTLIQNDGSLNVNFSIFGKNQLTNFGLNQYRSMRQL